MTDSLIRCPQCGHEFALSAAFIEDFEEDKKQSIQRAVREVMKKSESEKKEIQDRFNNELVQLKQELQEQAQKQTYEEYNLKLKEKDLELERIRTKLKELEKRTQQGSVELQGEALEAHLRASIEAACPRDMVRDVKKGEAGADLIQDVIDSLGKRCGSIVWEAKNTLHWNDEWIEKIKEDARRTNSSLRVIVSATLPNSIKHFDLVDGVWVSSIDSAPALARVLSENLVQVGAATRAVSGREDKLEHVYNYLTSPAFRNHLETLIGTWTNLQAQISKEEAVMKKQWAERRRQLDAVLNITVDLYSDISTIIGQDMPRVEGFELLSLPPSAGQLVD